MFRDFAASLFGTRLAAQLVAALPVEAVNSQRVALEPGDVLQLRAAAVGIRVVSGVAYLSHEGEDIILTDGEQIVLNKARYGAVISAEQKRSLLIEVRFR